MPNFVDFLIKSFFSCTDEGNIDESVTKTNTKYLIGIERLPILVTLYMHFRIVMDKGPPLRNHQWVDPVMYESVFANWYPSQEDIHKCM